MENKLNILKLIIEKNLLDYQIETKLYLLLFKPDGNKQNTLKLIIWKKTHNYKRFFFQRARRAEKVDAKGLTPPKEQQTITNTNHHRKQTPRNSSPTTPSTPSFVPSLHSATALMHQPSPESSGAARERENGWRLILVPLVSVLPWLSGRRDWRY